VARLEALRRACYRSSHRSYRALPEPWACGGLRPPLTCAAIGLRALRR
jgi:hypothetical protein